MSADCPDCQKWRERGVKFCATCGNVLEGEPKPAPKEKHPFFHLMIFLTVTIVVFIIVVNTVYCVLNFGDIIEECKNLRFTVSIPYGPGDIVLFKVSGKPGVAVMLGLCLAVQVLCLAYALYRFIPVILSEKDTDDEEKTDRTGMMAASAYLSASLFLSVVYLLLAQMSGNGADSSWMNDYTTNQLEFMLTRAGVREELMYRVVWIGIPMAAIALALHRDRRSWQYLLGGFGMSKAAFVFIIVSSILFGLAHMNGWGFSKVLDAIIGGIIFGYLFVEYGLYAAIIAHTANDTMSAIAYIGLGQGLEVMAMLSLVGIGLLVLIYWLIKPNMTLCDPRKFKTFPEKLEHGIKEQWGRH